MPVNICNINPTSQRYSELIIFDVEKYGQTLSHSLKKEIAPVPVGNEEMFVQLLPEDIKVKSVRKDNNAGGYFDVSIQFTIIDSREEVKTALDNMINKRLIVVLQNSIFKTVIGNEYEYLSFSYTEKRPVKYQDDTTYTITMKGKFISSIVDNFEPGSQPLPPQTTACEWVIIHN